MVGLTSGITLVFEAARNLGADDAEVTSWVWALCLGMAVLIQRQVAAAVSGVMFSRDPRDPAGNALLVEYCAGLGEALGEGHSQAGGRSGDDNDLVVESERVEQAHDGFLST